MFVGNRLKAGDFLTFVPVGLPLTLQYDSNGNLQKVYFSMTERNIDLTDELHAALVAHPSVPYHISIRNSTTWVKGVLYTSKLVKDAQGSLPYAIRHELVDMFLEDPRSFNFFASEVSNISTHFRGAVATRQWLTMSKFHTLPGLIVTTQFNERKYNEFVNSQNYSYRPGLVQGFVVFRQDNVLYIDNELYQYAVSKVKTETDRNGFIHIKLVCKDHEFSIDYTDAARLNLQPDSIVVTHATTGEICFNHANSGSIITWPKHYECPECHKYISVPREGAMRCDNPHCKTNLLSAVKQFLSGMNMPSPDDEKLYRLIQDNTITCVPDIFVIDEYQEFKISTTLSKLMRSIVPYSVVRDGEIFEVFTNKCANKLDVVVYYIEHTDKIKSELNLDNLELDKFINWLDGEYNFIDLQTLLHTENIQFTDTNKAFIGAPVFRGKTICITGRFRHGTDNRIMEILRSYDASIVQSYHEDVSIVVVGDTNEDINGQIIRCAKKDGKIVMTESAFFQQYGIDEDIQENLV